MGRVLNIVRALARGLGAFEGARAASRLAAIARSCPDYLEAIEMAIAERHASLLGFQATGDAALRFLGGARTEIEQALGACESGAREVSDLEILFGRLTYAEVLLHNAHDALVEEDPWLWEATIGLLATVLEPLRASVKDARSAADEVYHSVAPQLAASFA